MLSETSFSPFISASMRSSMALRFSGKTIELVAAAPDRQPSGEIAGHDALGGAGHGIDPLQHAPRHKDAAADAEHEDDQERPLRGLGDDAEQPPPFFEVAPDQQAKAVAAVR